MRRRGLVLFPAIMSGLVALALFSGFWHYNWRRTAPESFPLPPAQTLFNPTVSGGMSTPALPGIADEIIAVSPDTVQDVLRTISRPESYSAKYVTTYFFNSTQSSLRTSVYSLGGAVKIENLDSSGRPETHYLTYGNALCYWEDGSPILNTVSMGGRTVDAQVRIHTYEAILEMERGSILHASYEEYDGFPYITVETTGPVYDTKWWISLDTGLMHKAESADKDGSPAIAVMMSDFTPEPPPEELFNLPDGRRCQLTMDNGQLTIDN